MPLLLSSGTCVNACPPTYYEDSTDNSCKQCNETCGSCVGNSFNCTSCANSSLLLQGDGTCRETCIQANHFLLASNHSCEPCSLPCLTCQDNSTFCLSCQVGENIFLRPEDHTCQATCADNHQFGDVTDQLCKTCHDSCNSCVGPNLNNCSNCSNSTFYTLNPDGTCQIGCANSSYFRDETSATCHLCDSSCATCSINSTNCLSCHPPFFLNTHNNSCSATCSNPKEYGNSTDRICWPCDVSCGQCIGPEIANCTMCESG